MYVFVTYLLKKKATQAVTMTNDIHSKNIVPADQAPIPYPTSPRVELDPKYVAYIPEGKLRDSVFDDQAWLALIAHRIGTDLALASPLTKLDYLRSLWRFETWRAGRMLTRSLVEDYAAELTLNGRKLRYVRRELSAVRWWARKLTQVISEQPDILSERLAFYLRNFQMAGEVPDPKGELPKQGDVGYLLTQDEFIALIRACQADLSPLGVRDRALFAVASVAGFRIGDSRNIELSGVKKDEGNGLSYRVTTRTKGSKLRTVPIKGGAALCLRDWLAIRADNPGALFVPINKGKKLVHKKAPDSSNYYPPLSRSGLRKIFLTRLKEAGIEIKPDKQQRGRSWHDFRRTLVSSFLSNGMDLSAAKRFIGHANSNTTAGYDIRPDSEIERMAGERFVPYGEMVLTITEAREE